MKRQNITNLLAVTTKTLQNHIINFKLCFL